MNTGYALAWLVIVVFGLGAAALAFAAANAWRYSRALRWPLAALVLALALAPHRFDGEHAAPALVVAAFRWLFEDYADPLPAAQTAAAVAAAVLAASLVVAAALGVAHSRFGAFVARKTFHTSNTSKHVGAKGLATRKLGYSRPFAVTARCPRLRARPTRNT